MRVYNVLLTTDKPVYQPGQMIHLRSLLLDSNALKAAQGQPLVLTVADPEGNKLMRKELTTSDFGRHCRRRFSVGQSGDER
ncbi:MAG: MG2 domain-containing protein [Caldilineaceae bacterium]